ncbi:hypothetical protein CKN99_14335 [Carnobacterium maltaromaticum]|jgi:hypothetical protein|uniref:hypothetical protein n=1 Tax=Carnobacterium TaxID=2747 RepID=UPI00026C870B|nr:hypothetical protein [Carnobacterium maltaromaticum]AOA02917.1 hypothetical protein BFC23_10585 [Carnobacterium maltaromaticum]KRN71701.1 hypothetical protein IV76_GL003212 [Carnobacterium maltaromaticum]KRN86120.1 hypothetical protein IV75_GL001840 [Carnobacterium maltaromaticum]MBC9788964.1 hypothetical protein [Carnobacterium maltaromaticum]MBC9808977.1 hypothetical protein [Carnobacterium maltaromaticum]
MKKVTVRKEYFQDNNVFSADTTLDGEDVLRVIKDPVILADDEATYARLQNFEFYNGTIEVKVLSRLLPDAPDHARGFIGVSFRIDENNSHFEGIYIRPTNGRSEDQVRRNRSVQYFSYPDFKYDRFREENPGMYESYADIGLNEWIDMKIEVENNKAKLFLNNAEQPVLIVNDLKLGAMQKGGIGLWVDIGTEGFFKDLKINSL